MMTRKRQEFDRATKAEILRAAQRPTGFECAACGLIVARGDADHIIAQALYVEKRKLTAADGQFLCESCHDAKTKLDVGNIARAKRIEARDLGIRPPPAQKIQSRGFPKRERSSKIGKAKIEKQPMPRRGFYE
jgi:5-methylcytosine-specific restriction endonuclease McrA